MANDFTQDSDVVALYTLDSDILDSLQSNDLTVDPSPPPTTNISHVGSSKEGIGSLLIDVTNVVGFGATTTYVRALNASLSNDYPGKTGFTTTACTFCLWIKLHWVTLDSYLFGVGRSNAGLFMPIGNIVSIVDHFVSGESHDRTFKINNNLGMLEDRWYHVAYIRENNEGNTESTLQFLVYDQDISTYLVNKTTTEAPISGGSYVNLVTGVTNGGLLLGNNLQVSFDELVVFNRAITSDEALTIALGTYLAPGQLPSLATFPSERPDAYDPDFFWQPGEWTDPTTYVPGDWGTSTEYVATGGGRWGQNLVVAGNNKIYYEPHAGV